MIYRKITYLCLFILLNGCAGPYHPFGYHKTSVKDSSLNIQNKLRSPATKTTNKITIKPKAQVYHRAHSLKIEIASSEIGKKKDFVKNLFLLYNGQLIPLKEIKSYNLVHDNSKVTIEIPGVRLHPKQDHNISIILSDDNQLFQKEYAQPECQNKDLVINKKLVIEALRNHQDNQDPYLKILRKNSHLKNFILSNSSNKPFDQDLDSTSTFYINFLKILGFNIHKEDLRFNNEKLEEVLKSYLVHIKEFWEIPHHQRVLNLSFENQNIPYEELKLSSLLIGPELTMYLIKRDQKEWIKKNYNKKLFEKISLLKSRCQEVKNLAYQKN